MTDKEKREAAKAEAKEKSNAMLAKALGNSATSSASEDADGGQDVGDADDPTGATGSEESDDTGSGTGAESEGSEDTGEVEPKSSASESSTATVDKLLGRVQSLSASLAVSEAKLGELTVESSANAAKAKSLHLAATKACEVYSYQLGLPTNEYAGMSATALASAFKSLEAQFTATIPEGQQSAASGTDANSPEAPMGHPISSVR